MRVRNEFALVKATQKKPCPLHSSFPYAHVVCHYFHGLQACLNIGIAFCVSSLHITTMFVMMAAVIGNNINEFCDV